MATAIPRERQYGELKHIPWNSVELDDLSPMLRRQFVVGERVMVARILLKKGCVVPMHSHENEQITIILEGSLLFDIGGKDITVSAGQVLCIPSNMPHQATALEDTIDLDIFAPPRADWINRRDESLCR